jgi:ABC-2 type transport system ATP-binding protein
MGRARSSSGNVRAGSASRVATAPLAATDAGSDTDVIEITGMNSDAVGTLAAAHGIVLFELTPIRASLEEAFMELTKESVEYHATEANR